LLRGGWGERLENLKNRMMNDRVNFRKICKYDMLLTTQQRDKNTMMIHRDVPPVNPVQISL
jgi:hypothetical protein